MDATAHVECAFHGRTQLDRTAIGRLYSGGHVRHETITGLRLMADLFCFSESCLIADVIQALTTAGVPHTAAHVYTDVCEWEAGKGG